MFKTFFLSELKYSLKQPMVYIFLVLMALFTFGATVSDNIQIGGTVGSVYKNAPHIITIYTTIMTIFGLLIAAAYYNNAALKDYNNNFNEILFSSPLKKSGFYFGRFFGALVMSTMPMIGVFLGVIIGTILAPIFGWVDADRFGDFYLQTFISNYFIFILPNMFFAGTIIFAMANKWKSTVVSFLGSLLIIVGYIVSGELISDIDNETLGGLADTFGVRAYSLTAKYYTPIEKNTLNPTFTGLLLYNRLLWMALGVIILLLSYFSFSFKDKKTRVKKAKSEKKEARPDFKMPQLNPAFNGRTEWLQFKSFFYTNFINIAKSVTFKILFLFSAIILITNLIGGFEYFGLQTYPLTYKIIDTIDGAVGIFVVIILVFFSGELIWRDRDNKINEVVDATPHTSLISLSAKALSLIAITTVLHAFFVLVGVIYQLANGFTRIELDIYFLEFFYSTFITYVVWSGVMILIQVKLNNKYIGYFVSIMVVFVWSIMLSIFDVESNMLVIGGRPFMVYSDMNGFGPALIGAIWFNIYWVLFSILCLMAAGALWNRGVMTSLKDRLLATKKQVPKSYKILMLATTVIWVGVAAFVYYNTQVLNKYKTSDETEQLLADYEKKYKHFEHVKLPKVTDVKYHIDIFPEKRDVLVNAEIRLTNETDSRIDSIHFNIDERWEPKFEIPNSSLVLNDEHFGYMIFALKNPMLPGESMDIKIKTQYISKGFENGAGNTNIVRNGTFLNNFSILPALGYQPDIELSDKNTRKKYDLPPKERMPKLESVCSDKCMSNYLSNGHSDYINVESVISTSKDQIAIGPGSLVKKWEENGRNYFHYKVDHPSQNFYSFMSAKYEVKTRKWNGIDIEVYYDAKHPQNVDMMLDAVERSLKYYTANFGPYMHKQCRILEFPRYDSFAQAFPGTMPYSEAIGFVINLEDEEDNNIVDAVIAHEMAHQWWAHQVVGANMQGATMFSESFAEYSALMTMKGIAKTPMKMREFLKYDHERYLRGRSSEVENELPLYKVENQMHIHYGKGSVILYALQDYIGEANVNAAMKSFLEEYRYQKPPYPTSLDFLRHLEPQVADSMKYLIDDWFKEITLYDNRLVEADYKQLENGKYQINMSIEARKLNADTVGNETPKVINDWIDLGAFADSDEEILIFEKRVKVNQEKMSFTFEIDEKPAKLAIDPRRLLVDRVYTDNIKTADIKE